MLLLLLFPTGRASNCPLLLCLRLRPPGGDRITCSHIEVIMESLPLQQTFLSTVNNGIVGQFPVNHKDQLTGKHLNNI